MATLVVTAAIAVPITAPVATARTAHVAKGQAVGPHGWRPDIRSARRWAAHRRGRIEFAVLTPRHGWCVRCWRTARTQSTAKVLLMLADLRSPGIRNSSLSGWRKAELSVMIRRSDNVAAHDVFNRVGRGGMTAVAHAAHLKHFSANNPWYASRITAADGARLMLYVDRLFPRRHARFGMNLLSTIVPGQRWGIGQTKPRCWSLYFKGGWGDGSGDDDHQFALLRHFRQRVAVAITVSWSPSHAYGKETLHGIAKRLLHDIPRPRGCGTKRKRKRS